MSLFGDIGNFLSNPLGAFDRPGTTSARVQPASNPFQFQAPVIPVPNSMMLNSFQASAPSASAAWNPFVAQAANLSESDYSGAIQKGQDIAAGGVPLIGQGAQTAQGAAGSLTNLAGQNVVSPSTQQMGDVAGQIRTLGGQQAAGGALGQQQSLADALRAQMEGRGPSLAQLQLQQASNQNIQNAAGLLGSVRGINPAQMARGISQAATTQNAQAGNASAQIRMAEQLAAQQQLAGVLGQLGGQQMQQQGLQGQLLGAAGGLYGQQGGLNLAQQQAQGQMYGQAGQLGLGVGQLGIGQVNAGTGLFGAGATAQNQQNANRISNVAQQNQYNSATAAQNASMQTNVSLANAGFNLDAQRLNQMTGAQNASLGLGYNQLMQNAYSTNASNYLAAQQGQAGIYGQNAALAQQASGANAGIQQTNAANENSFWGGLINAGGGVLGAALGAHKGGIVNGGVGNLGGYMPYADTQMYAHEGGEVPSYAGGGSVGLVQPVAPGGGISGYDMSRFHPIQMPGGLMEVPINMATSLAGNQIAAMYGGTPGSRAETIAGTLNQGIGAKNASGIFGGVPATGSTAGGDHIDQAMAQGYADAVDRYSRVQSGMVNPYTRQPMMNAGSGPGGAAAAGPQPENTALGQWIGGALQQHPDRLQAILAAQNPQPQGGPNTAWLPQPFGPPADFSRFFSASGGQVPGRPNHPGRDVASNDTVQAELTPGEIVLPLTVTQSTAAPSKAAQFVRDVQAQKGQKSGPSYGHVVAARRRAKACRGGKVA